MNRAIPLFPAHPSVNLEVSRIPVVCDCPCTNNTPIQYTACTTFRIYHHPTSHTPSSNGPTNVVTKLNWKEKFRTATTTSASLYKHKTAAHKHNSASFLTAHSFTRDEPSPTRLWGTKNFPSFQNFKVSVLPLQKFARPPYCNYWV